MGTSTTEVVMDKYLHDMKAIASLMKHLTSAIDQLFLDVENKQKEKDNGADHSGSKHLVAGSNSGDSVGGGD